MIVETTLGELDGLRLLPALLVVLLATDTDCCRQYWPSLPPPVPVATIEAALGVLGAFGDWTSCCCCCCCFGDEFDPIGLARTEFVACSLGVDEELDVVDVEAADDGVDDDITFAAGDASFLLLLAVMVATVGVVDALLKAVKGTWKSLLARWTPWCW